MEQPTIIPPEYPIKPKSLQHPPYISVPDRKTRSLFRWIARVTGVDACWVEGIDNNEKLVWAITKKLTSRLWYIVSQKFKPALALTALSCALLLSTHPLCAQTSRNLDKLNGTDGFVLKGIEAGDRSGRAVAAGDINGDGTSDVIIGAYQGDTDTGKTYVVFGRSEGFPSSIELSDLNGSKGFAINGLDTNDHSGRAVSTGDISGDGFDDVIIGAWRADPNDSTGAGETYVVFGGSSVGSGGNIELSGLDGNNGFILNGTNAGDRSGQAVATGDINGDGTSDVIIGAYGGNPNSRTGAGETYVIFGKSTDFSSFIDLSNLSGSNGFVLNGIDPGDVSGFSVGVGDINGDGIDDVIIGARNAAPNDSTGAGETYVVFGNSDGFVSSIELSDLNGSNGFILKGINADDNSGYSVSAGDINGDGAEDVIIGARRADPNGNGEAGETYVVFGNSDGFVSSIELSDLNGSNGFILKGIDADDNSGGDANAGDINGDGIDDVIVGAIFATNSYSGAGETYVVFGGSSVGSGGTIELSGLDGSKGFALNGADATDLSGISVAAGDINDDGIEDVVVGAFLADPNGTGEAGETYIFFNGRSQTVTGNGGFRTLSAPTSGTVFDELLGSFWTQGVTGSDGPSAANANVWVWDEGLDTDGDWVPFGNQTTDNLDAGQGFLFYMFSDDDFDGMLEGFPKTINTVEFGGNGTLNSGTVNPVSNLGDGRFFLAGNPYDRTIDWDLLTASRLTNTVYVYDDARPAFISWNGTSGDLTDGLIAPFQGFFIQGSGGNGSLTIEEADMVTTEGTFYKQDVPEPLVLKLELETGGRSNPAWLQFDEQAELGRDRLDGLELQPLAGSYLQLYTTDSDGKSLNINALPVNEEGIIEIPLQMLRVQGGTSTEGTGTLRWSGLDTFPAGWRIMLMDTRTGQEIDLSLATEHSVSIEANSDLKTATGQQQKIPRPVMQSSSEENRYLLKVTTDDPAGPAGLPASVALRQNYPNPFNPATVIRFELPETQDVSLEIFDLNGRRIATLLDGQRSAGFHQIQWAPENLASGLYLYKLRAGNRVITKKMMLIK